MRHDNLLKAFGGFVKKGTLYGIFELLDHSVVAELQARDRVLDQDVLRKYTFQILQGVRFLHDRNVSSLSRFISLQFRARRMWDFLYRF